MLHNAHTMHIMQYLLIKGEIQMAFGAVDGVDCGPRRGLGAGIAAVVVIILLLIAMGIVF